MQCLLFFLQMAGIHTSIDVPSAWYPKSLASQKYLSQHSNTHKVTIPARPSCRTAITLPHSNLQPCENLPVCMLGMLNSFCKPQWQWRGDYYKCFVEKLQVFDGVQCWLHLPEHAISKTKDVAGTPAEVSPVTLPGMWLAQKALRGFKHVRLNHLEASLWVGTPTY